MPNFPNYRLDIAPPCDPNIVSGLWEYHVEYSQVSIYPNPTSRSITIELGDQWVYDGIVDVRITDQTGRTLVEEHIPSVEKNHMVALDQVPPRIYFVMLTSGLHSYMGKIIKLYR